MSITATQIVFRQQLNRGEKMKSYQLLLPCLLLVSACAGLPPVIENAPAVNLSYLQVSRDRDSFKDVPVRWGGVIIDVENEAQFSLMQVVYYPLDYSGRPQIFKQGEGRFVVKIAEFLDPVVYVKNKTITVAGMLNGSIERTVGKRVIQVPLISATAIHLWPTNPNRYDYPNYGPYPYFGYPGYFPYYPRGFYGPYYRW
jgi:outer membrane lipoprotein